MWRTSRCGCPLGDTMPRALCCLSLLTVLVAEPQQSSPLISAEGLLSLVLECLSLSLTQLGKSQSIIGPALKPLAGIF